MRGEKLAFFRKIVVDGREYEWKFSFDDYDWHEPSHLVFRSLDRTLKIILQFHTDADGIGKCPFNSGVPAIKEGQSVTINLNQPRFVAEILQYLLVSCVQLNTKGILNFEDGTDILRILGYQFEYQFFFK